MKNGYYSSGEFAKMAHITIRTVRYYDKQNVLKPSYVNENGARFYTDADFVRLQQILLLKYLGFSLEDIRNMTVVGEDSHIIRDSLDLQLKLVEDQIAQMQLVAKAIRETKEALKEEDNMDWSQMLNLIHMSNMEGALKSQYQHATNITARIRLHADYSTNQQGWFPWVFEQCKFGPKETVLELGCGNGAFWLENKDYIPKDCKIVLNDISEGMLRDTQKVYEEFWKNKKDLAHFQFEAFDCHKIPYEDHQFSYVIANHVLFYCNDLDAVIREIYRVLKPGGKLICSTYGKKHMKEITELVQEFHSSITLSATHLYDQFGLENGQTILRKQFKLCEMHKYEDSLEINKAEPLIDYILSCHGNQNQYIIDRYKDFKNFVEKKVMYGYHVTKEAGLFVCTK